jgi:hypothetical protein
LGKGLRSVQSQRPREKQLRNQTVL